ncbi:MAG: hypothetical protein ACLVB5_01110 [Christensenellales bacterium]
MPITVQFVIGLIVELFSATPPPYVALLFSIVPLLMVRVELYAYKPPPIPASDVVHPLIVPPLMLTVELYAYKPPPLLAEHPLIVPC